MKYRIYILPLCVAALFMSVSCKDFRAKANLKHGLEFDEEGDHLEAIAAYKRAIELKPDYEEAWFDLGMSYFTLSNYEEAAAAFEKTLELREDFRNAHLFLGMTYQYLERYNEAAIVYLDAIDKELDDGMTWCKLGDAYDKLGRKEDAATSYQTGLTRFPNDCTLHYNMALMHLRKGNKAAAQAEYDILEPLNASLADELKLAIERSGIP